MQAWRALLLPFFPLVVPDGRCPLCRPTAFAGSISACTALHRVLRCLPVEGTAMRRAPRVRSTRRLPSHAAIARPRFRS